MPIVAQSGNAVTLGLRPAEFHLSPGGAKLSQAVPVAMVAAEVFGPEVIQVCALGGKGDRTTGKVFNRPRLA